MDAQCLRFVLIALAGSIAISLNIPWRHTARAVARCLAVLKEPRQPLARLPWEEITRDRTLAVVPVADPRLALAARRAQEAASARGMR